MPTLWIPESRQEATARAAAEEHRQMLDELERVAAALDHYNRELAKIDPHLEVMLAKPTTTVEGLKPGYYHIIRKRPGHFAYIKPVEGPNGEWRDLDSSIFELVAQDDLWNDRLQREQRRKQRKALEARDRDRQRESQDRAREIDARIKSLNSTSILVPRSI